MTILPTLSNSGAIRVQQNPSRKHLIFLDLQTSVKLLTGKTLLLAGEPDLPFEILVTPTLVGANLVSVKVTVF